MSEMIRGWWGSALCNPDFICIETYSGYHSGTSSDHKGKQNFLEPSASDEKLGLSVIDALAHSRFVLPAPRFDVWIHPDVEFDLDLDDYKKRADRYVLWTKNLMTSYGYKTKRALFKDLQNCGIESKNGLIKITPMRREGAEGWEGLGKGMEGIVEIPATSTPAEIGAALRLAFTRCTQ